MLDHSIKVCVVCDVDSGLPERPEIRLRANLAAHIGELLGTLQAFVVWVLDLVVLDRAEAPGLVAKRVRVDLVA